jgi:hypothetical protein
MDCATNADFMWLGGVMSNKRDNKKWNPDEIEFDLDKLSEYMRNLQPGQYARAKILLSSKA